MLGILCGLESEAVIARNIKGAIVACAGARPQQARSLARELVAKGATRLMSFGIAGGLASELPLGALVIGTDVKSLNGTWACDPTWGRELAARLPQARTGGVWGSEILIPTAGDKRELLDKTGCIIVDMESQCAAEIAAEVNLPLAVVRAVCDSATMDVPPVLMASITPEGYIHYGRAAWHIARHPLEIPDLFHVARGINSALAGLRRCTNNLT
jgi:hopanoid-associated phosphorylase